MPSYRPATDNHMPLETINGSVERVTFHSEESGFCVLRTKVRGHRELVTIVGHSATIRAGEYVESTGSWITNKKHGLQFKATHLKSIPPSTLDGIEKYLGSGMIRGIGPHFAKKLVRAFGDDVFDVIEHKPQKLQSLPGIGKKRTQQITDAWAEQKVIRDIMVFLQSHGVGTARAVRIYKTYGDLSIQKVCENPYCLALDIRGIGFKTADQIAQKLGIAPDSIIRAQAGVRHTAQEFSQSGHCAVYLTELTQQAQTLLNIPETIVQHAIQDEITAKRFETDTIKDQPIVYLAALYHAEVSVAHILRLLLTMGNPPWGKIDASKAITWVENRTKLTLSNSQKEAVQVVLNNKVSIITGGPGVGKTTLLHSLLQIIRAKHIEVALCAPTGRAAKRLSETTGLPAKTIHRLLAFDPHTFSFKHQQSYPLPCDVLIVDEASMLDITLMHHLLKAVPPHAALILVGDVDQLPSVGPGTVLSDCIQSGTIPTIFLTEIFRQSAESRIIINAHRINHGEMPLKTPHNTVTDFYFIPSDTPEDIHDKLLHVTTERIPEKFGYCPLTDIQVLTPMNRGGIGTRHLNVALQKILNPYQGPTVSRFGWTFAPGDKVMQTVNNYDKNVFNGDMGYIRRIHPEDQNLVIEFDGKPIVYDFGDLDEITLAYAISIHKSQGSEYPVVVIPIAMQHYCMLARNLLYTAVTRGKSLVVIIGRVKALAIAVKQINARHRLTKLAERLV